MSLTGTFIRNIIAPMWALKEKSPYLKHVRTIKKMHHRSHGEVAADQLLRLKKLISHAATQTDYYHHRYLNKGIAADSLTSVSDLQHFPLITKDDLRQYKDQMVARNFAQSSLIAKKTSGSTGVSVELFVDEASSQWKRAVTVAYDRWTGWNIGEPVGAIWGNPEVNKNWRTKLRNKLLGRYFFLDTLKMNETTMRVFYAQLVKKKPAILFGHAHSLFLFARFMENNNLTGVYPKGIISTCMVLHDFERHAIERVFGCRVTNRYGCEEVSLIACECSQGNMHLNMDSLIVEFIRDGRPVPPGEPGAIVVTDLTNYGMPLIRYKVGDVGVLSDKKQCPCGCTYPIMATLEGRVADYVVTPDGDYISGISLTENFAMHLPGVKQMQIVQERVDHLVFRIVKGSDFSDETVRDISRLTLERFGDRMQYVISYVDSIQSEASGKYRFCISKLQNPFS